MKSYFILPVILCSLLCAHGQEGSLDASFAGKGWTIAGFKENNSLHELGRKVLPLSGGASLVVIEANGYTLLTRYLSGGKLDKSFGAEGYSTPLALIPKNAVLQSNGKIVVAGYIYNSNSGYDFALARFNSNGSPDASFDRDGWLTTDFANSDEFASSLAVQGDGKIVVAGYTSNRTIYDNFSCTNTNYAYGYRFALARYNSDGSPDYSFDSDGRVTTCLGLSEMAFALALQKDGKIVVAGQANNYSGSSIDFILARYNSNGSPDNTFDGDGYVFTDFTASTDVPTSLVIQTDGKIVAAGFSNKYNTSGFDFALARYKSNGSPDNFFDGDGKVITDFGGEDFALTAALQSNGKIVVAGYSNVNRNLITNNLTLARYNTNGSPDYTFDGDGRVTTDLGLVNETVASVAVQTDGKIVAAGSGQNSNNFNYDVVLTRYKNNGSPDNAFDGDGWLTGFYPVSQATVEGMAVQADGKIIIAGYLYETATAFDFALARFNSDGSPDYSFDGDGWLTTDFDSYDYASSLALQADGKIVVAGRTYNRNTGNYDFVLVRYNSDGSLDNTFDGDGKLTVDFGGDESASYVALQSDGKIVVAVNAFDNSTGNSDITLLRYNSDGSPDNTFDGDGKQTAGFSENEYAAYVTFQRDGKILVAGSAFNNSTGNSDFALLRFNSNGSPDNTFDSDGIAYVDFGNDEISYSLALQSDGKIVVAGHTFNAVTFYDFALARCNSNGSLDNTFDADGKLTTDFSYYDFANSLVLQRDGKIIAAGYCFNAVTGYDFALARYNGNGSPDNTFDNDGKLATDFFGYDFGSHAVLKNDRLYIAGYTSNSLGSKGIVAAYFTNCTRTFFRDYDGDGYGNANKYVKACSVPAGYVSKGSDCNDAKSTINPGASEIVNSIDDNCNGLIDENTVTVSAPGTAEKEIVAYGLQVKVISNPSLHSFNLVIQSSGNLPVQVRVLDILGITVERKMNIACNTTVQVGAHLRPGVYLAEVEQGTEKRIVRLVKQ